MAPAGKSLETVLADTPENWEEMSAEEQAAWTDDETAKYNAKHEEDDDSTVWGDMIAGMFWPNDTTSDAGHYTLGSRFKVNAALNLTCDLGGEVNWGLMGLNIINNMSYEYTVGGDETDWVVYVFQDKKINLSHKLAHMTASAYQSEFSAVRQLASLADAAIFLSDSSTSIYKQEFSTVSGL